MPDLPQRVLHVFNYAWPRIDGYVVRSMGLVMAQQRHLGIEVAVAVSPFAPLAKAADPDFRSPLWGPGLQIEATDYADAEPGGVEGALRPLERPPLGLAPFTFPVYRRELRSIIRRLEPDLVHAHHPHYNAEPARTAAAALGVPFVYELRCFNGDYDLDHDSAYFRARGRWLNALERRLCRRANTIVTISDGLKDRIVRAGVPAERVFVVRNSVNTELFTPPAEATPPGATIRVGYATTFEQMEGLDIFVEAAARAADRLRKQGRALEVTIAGTGRDWDRIDGLVRELGLEDTVRLPGFVPYGQMPDFYRSLDLFVVPRRHAVVSADTTPLKPLEALASGLPLLVSDLPAMRELLAARPDVRFFEPNAGALADALVGFADAPWQGTGDIEERSWKREIRTYEQVYAHALAAHDGRRSAGDGVSLSLPVRAAKTVIRQAADRGLGPLRPLDTHIVVCGFPRSGSTLLQLIAGLCVEDVMTFDEEVDALWAARWANRRHRFMLTKMPGDIAHVEAVRTYYRTHLGRAHFALTVRDPRDVLTSTHDAYPAARGYYVSAKRWQAVYDRMQRLRDDPDVTVVRYEDLTTCPDRVQQDLTDAVGWTVRHPFDRYYEVAQAGGLRRDSMTEGALGGFRPLDASGLARWRKPEHRERIGEVLAALPGLPDALVALGYEDDHAWLEEIEAAV